MVLNSFLWARDVKERERETVTRTFYFLSPSGYPKLGFPEQSSDYTAACSPLFLLGLDFFISPLPWISKPLNDLSVSSSMSLPLESSLGVYFSNPSDLVLGISSHVLAWTSVSAPQDLHISIRPCHELVSSNCHTHFRWLSLSTQLPLASFHFSNASAFLRPQITYSCSCVFPHTWSPLLWLPFHFST